MIVNRERMPTSQSPAIRVGVEFADGRVIRGGGPLQQATRRPAALLPSTGCVAPRLPPCVSDWRACVDVALGASFEFLDSTPSALVPLAGICAGGRAKGRSLRKGIVILDGKLRRFQFLCPMP